MKIITWISRILVGALFIVSGLIKANDPMGFAYKLQDYYTVFAEYNLLGFFNSGLFMNTALELSILICIVEVALGVALLFGSKMKLVGSILLVMIIFFTILTGFSAITGKVTDCGCFGDALKLTPWQSFLKDVVLLLLIIPIFLWRGRIPRNRPKEDLIALPIALAGIILFSLAIITWAFPIWFSLVLFVVLLLAKRLITSKQIDWIMAGISFVVIGGFSIYCVSHLPIEDFRPYKPGNNVCDLREGVPDELKFYYVLKNLESGETKEFEKFPDNWKESWEFVESRSEVIKKGEAPKIHNFSFSDGDGNDVTQEFLDDPGYKFLVVIYNLDKASSKAYDEISALQQAVEDRGIPFIGASASLQKEVEIYRHEHQLAFPIYQADETELKTIVRSVPGLMLMKGCEVVDKWHWRDIPSWESLQDQLK